MKVGLFSPYLSTMGGGERYFLTAGEFFLLRGDDVTLFSSELNLASIEERFGINLKGLKFKKNIFFENLIVKLIETSKYDLIFYLSDGSIPFSLAKKNILHFQTPFKSNFKSFKNTIKLHFINSIVCNSQFTKKFIDSSYGIKSLVIYPPVDVASFKPSKKENLILSVGRFFAPSHPKKQEAMIEAFETMCKDGLKDWKLILIGGVTGDSSKNVSQLRERYHHLPVEIITDVSFSTLKDYYAKSKIYWHAAGLDEDLENFPSKAEHFGITTVEAMAAGCVPLVFAGGGQMEIVRNNIDGYLWETIVDLQNKTNDLISDATLLNQMSKNSQSRCLEFSKKTFFDNLKKVVEA